MTVYFFPFALAAFLALVYEIGLGKYTDYVFYRPVVFALAIFAGLRWEVGPLDWEAYEQFFSELDTWDASRFEVGYWALNYAVQRIGGSYAWVQLLASLFTAYALLRLTARYRVNRFYVLAIYIGYSFLILQFAQVRQSIAIGFFLLGFDRYVRTQRLPLALAMMLAGVTFQYSAALYIAIFLAAIAWPRFAAINFWAKAAIVWCAIYAVAAAVYFIDPYAALSVAAATTSAQEKLEIYQSTTEAVGPALLVFGAYLCFMAWYLARYGDGLVNRYAVLTLLTAVLLMLAFRGSYVMYSRAYVVACIFQAIATACVLAERRGAFHRFVFLGSISVAAIYFVRILSISAEYYVPYRSVFG